MSNRRPICYSVDAINPQPAVIRAAVDELRRGRLIAYPTETVYGLGADPRQSAALELLFGTKGRSAEHSIPLIAGSREQIETHVGCLPPTGRRLADTFWPGPLTLVVAAYATLPDRLLGGRDSVAVRIPSHPVARALADDLAYPITATSANQSGGIAATTAAAAMSDLGSDLSVVLDGGATIGDLPSTIVDVRGSDPVLLRAGKVPWERVLQSLS